jgi:hypothetical protein
MNYAVTVEKKLSDFPNMQNHPNLEIIEDHIWVIHNFLTDEECNHYVTTGEAATEEEWHAHNTEWWIGKFLPMPDDDYTSEMIQGISARLRGLLGDGDFEVGAPLSVHRQKEGQFMFDHADNPNETDHKNNHVLTSFVCYFSDFNGGNIYYKHLGLEYHPRKGDLVIHPGTERYRHGTRPVEPGPIRYNGTLWTYDPEVVALHAEGRVFEETDEINPVNKAKMMSKPEKPPKLL